MWKSSESKIILQSRPAIPPALAENGQKVLVVSVQAGKRLRAHLCSLGLLPGVEAEVMKSPCNRPVIIAINGSRIMLGKGIAYKIMVR